MPPRNAYYDPRSGQVLRETYGRKLDVKSTVDLLMQAPAHSRILPVYITLDPEVTAKDYSGLDKLAGAFSTWYGGGARGENIRIASNFINYTLLAPGEVFSFNQVTGPRTPEKGYKMAPVIVGGTVVPGYGGGVCQVSTTLYNAVLQAGLQVVERFPHSRAVDYVPRGRDATVSDYLDFKFRNNTDRFLIIRAYAGGGHLRMEIWE